MEPRAGLNVLAFLNRNNSPMLANLTPCLLHGAVTAVSLWVASHLFKGIRFSSTGALTVSALWGSLFIAVLGGTPDFQIQTSPAPGSGWL